MSNESIDSQTLPKKNKQKGHYMSAYLVTPDHIGQLVLWYLQNKTRGLNSIVHDGKDIFLDPKDLVLHLAVANMDSVCYRYKHARDNRQDSFCGDVWQYIKKVRHAVKISHADAYNMAKCLRYQSCEHPWYKGSAAEKLLDMIQDTAASRLAAGAKVSWDYEDDFSEHGQITVSQLAKRQKGVA